MGKILSGFTSKTAERLLLGAGAFFKDFDIGTDTYETAKETKLIGATQGGGSFSAVPTVRRIEIDGVSGAAKGLEVIDEWTVTMTANVKEVTAESLALALGPGKKGAGVEGYDKITANANIAISDYMNNITWVGTLSGSKKPLIIVVKNALSINGLSMTVAAKSEATVPITVTGHYDADNLDEPPFEIYYPKKAGGDA